MDFSRRQPILPDLVALEENRESAIRAFFSSLTAARASPSSSPLVAAAAAAAEATSTDSAISIQPSATSIAIQTTFQTLTRQASSIPTSTPTPTAQAITSQAAAIVSSSIVSSAVAPSNATVTTASRTQTAINLGSTGTPSMSSKLNSTSTRLPSMMMAAESTQESKAYASMMSADSSNRLSPVTVKILIAVGIFVFLAVLGSVLFLLWRRKKKRTSAAKTPELQLTPPSVGSFSNPFDAPPSYPQRNSDGLYIPRAPSEARGSIISNMENGPGIDEKTIVRNLRVINGQPITSVLSENSAAILQPFIDSARGAAPLRSPTLTADPFNEPSRRTRQPPPPSMSFEKP